MTIWRAILDVKNYGLNAKVSRPSSAICRLTATHCNALQQRIATHCNSLQLHTTLRGWTWGLHGHRGWSAGRLQHTATCCNNKLCHTLQLAATTHYTTLNYTTLLNVRASRYRGSSAGRLQHTATRCNNTLQHTVTHCNSQYTAEFEGFKAIVGDLQVDCHALQHAAPRCNNTPQLNATHCNYTLQHAEERESLKAIMNDLMVDCNRL